MLEIWPNARYYIHGGVGFEPYTAQFAKMFPSPDFKYFEVYNASEGYFAVQDRADERGMLLLTNNDIYYEFISLDELANDQPQTLTLQDVEIGHNYAIVITTSSGLWRYMPGDTIVFTCLHPFRIKVSGRTKHFINVFGEEVMVGNTDMALAETTRMLPAIVSDYTVAPIFLDGMHKGGHLWVIEFEKLPNDISAYAQLLDENLQLINSDYAAKREADLSLQAP